MTARTIRLPTFLKASWGVGAIGTTSMLYLVNMFLVYFLVRHVGLQAGIAGSLLGATRVYDAVINPLVGTLSDHTAGARGRRRPWLLAGTILAPVACIAVFNVPPALSGGSLYAWISAALLLYFTAYSVYSIPYMALGTELTDDYVERASVVAWRTFFVYCSGLVITSGAPALVALLGRTRAAYSTMSFVAAGVVGATMLWTVAFTASATVTTRVKERLPAGVWIRTIIANVPYRVILVAKLCLQLGTAFHGASALFFMTYVLQRGEGALALFGLVSNVAGIAAVPMWSRVMRGMERRPLFLLLLMVNLLVHGSWLLATPGESVALFILRSAVGGLVGSGSVLVSVAMLTDTIEYDRLVTGQRREGLFAGGFEFVQTTSFMIGPLVVGLAFSLADLVPGQVSLRAQPDSALRMIRIAFAMVPAACCAAGMALLLPYRLSAARLLELREARSAAAASAGA